MSMPCAPSHSPSGDRAAPALALVPPAARGQQAPPRRPPSREVVESYLPLVRRTVRRLARRLPSHLAPDELEAAGVRGLLDALARGEGEGAAFEAYVRIRVRGAVVDELRRLDWLPRRVRRAAGEGGEGAGVRLAGDVDESEWDAATVDTSATPAEAAEGCEAREGLAAALMALPEREQIVVSMRYFDGAGFREISERLGVSEPRASQLHARAVAMLRAALGPGDDAPPAQARAVAELRAALAGAAPSPRRRAVLRPAT